MPEPDWANVIRMAGDPDVYAAEEEFGYRLCDELIAEPWWRQLHHGDDPDDPLDPEAVSGFIREVLNRSDWEWASLPEVRFDVPDDSDVAGVHGGASTGAIHLHPKLARPLVVLHELAHWIRPRDGHGDQFRSTMVELVEVAFGGAAAELLREEYDERGLPHG